VRDRERRRRHDDAHHPFGGRGGRARPSRGRDYGTGARLVPYDKAPNCLVCGLGKRSHPPDGPLKHPFESDNDVPK
jgi:hypothetical protein